MINAVTGDAITTGYYALDVLATLLGLLLAVFILSFLFDIGTFLYFKVCQKLNFDSYLMNSYRFRNMEMEKHEEDKRNIKWLTEEEYRKLYDEGKLHRITDNEEVVI